jgi:hypothetical protein
MMTLVRLAGWKPHRIKAMTRRERRFWAEWYLAVEDQKVMDQMTA